ncbi:hypothetical protein [Flammeovirga kamogawensis]|uniref:VWA domain-containing protein n=1 Tax=Flammeovirga kamogawensis TaxID=373891 RepID=A0ABX8GXD8_9BACT|nr:hypothetical protein [Flammeovirga kamogawensis]MBB6461316.1 hypothetical protein [Flammeovirga kamogawensis]QWG07872.1 hypothetical protein KM029_02715 [Flammeovirga kamogawensis]TRX69679.1 hypothetical protein EO216_16650 [Flammeovirga kamogawensis]
MDGVRRDCKWLIGFFILLFLITEKSNGQTAERIYFKAAYRSVDHLEIDSTKHFFTLPMSYGQSEINRLPEADEISRLQIDSVLLVYTDHPKDFDFSLLNIARIDAFSEWFDGAIDDPVIRWRIIKQTKGTSKLDFENLFHGIVVYYKKHPRKELSPEKELKRKKAIDHKFDHLVKQKLKLDEEVESHTSKVFEKHKEEWNKVVVISDWTGSMYPYTIDLLSWLMKERAQDQVEGFVFFNDGDAKMSHHKEIGKTGGIYEIHDSKVMPVMNLMQKVKQKGDGGDLPENDLEALIYAQENFPEASTFILIADNDSEVRDISLLSTLNKPIHIVLNKADFNKWGVPKVLIDYKEIAITTEGAIYVNGLEYTTKQEILDLPNNLIEGQ